VIENNDITVQQENWNWFSPSHTPYATRWKCL